MDRIGDRIGLGLVGIGKIARDQHLPALRDSAAFALLATASRHGRIDGVDGYADVASMLAAQPDIRAVSLCTPPGGRFEQALAAIEAGVDVMLEKPPVATVTEAKTLADAARANKVVLFATWHSREAAEVDAARDWLAARRIDSVRIEWREDIRRWHPGQEWILEAGGFGVFDPGINALSIATRILPQPLAVETAVLETPANRASPIAATIRMRSGTAPVAAHFDFLQTGPQTWDIVVETDAGTLRLSQGGSVLELPDAPVQSGANREYPRLYERFAELISRRECDVDLRPLQLVADTFLVGEHRAAAPFDF